MNNWKSQKGTGEMWIPTKDSEGNMRYVATDNDFLDGYYTKIKEGVGENNQTVYTLETQEGIEKQVWGTSVLNEQMASIKMGSYIRIKWNGMKLTKEGASKFKTPQDARAAGKTKMTFHDYEVFVSQDTTPMEVHSKTSNASVSSAPVATNNTNSVNNVNPWAEKESASQPQNNVVAGASSFPSDDLPF